MKAFALAVAATAGLLLSASTADAQYRSRGSYRTYSYPSYSYAAPAYGYSTYSYPAVGTVVAPTYVDSGVVVTSGYTPTYSPAVYPSGYSYPSTFGTPYSGSYYGSSNYYNSSSYYGNGTYISPSGGYVGGRRVIRW